MTERFKKPRGYFAFYYLQMALALIYGMLLIFIGIAAMQVSRLQGAQDDITTQWLLILCAVIICIVPFAAALRVRKALKAGNKRGVMTWLILEVIFGGHLLGLISLCVYMANSGLEQYIRMPAAERELSEEERLQYGQRILNEMWELYRFYDTCNNQAVWTAYFKIRPLEAMQEDAYFAEALHTMLGRMTQMQPGVMKHVAGKTGQEVQIPWQRQRQRAPRPEETARHMQLLNRARELAGSCPKKSAEELYLRLFLQDTE